MLTTTQIKWLGPKLALYKPLEDDSTQSDFHKSNADIKWFFGGNQSGKTHTNMVDLAQVVLNIHPFKKINKGTHWCCIESWEQVRDILWADNLEQLIPKHHIANIVYGQDKVPRKVFLKNGHKIEFKAFNQGRELFQGRAIDSCYCDEQCHHDFVGIFDEIQARLLVKEGYISWSMTPVLPQPELEERIEDLPDTDEVFYANLNSNRKSRGGYIADDRIDKLIASWPAETQTTRIEGKFASFHGAVYSTFSRQVHVIKPFPIPEGWGLYRGFDFGFTNPFCCLWMAKDKDENWYVFREYYKARTGIQEHISTVKRLSGKEQYLVNWADPENAENRSDMRKAGIVTRCAHKDIARGIELVQSKLKIKENKKPSLFIFNTCRNTAREFPSYHYPKGTKKNNPADIPVGKDDHTLDVVRYVVYSTDGKRKKGSVRAA